MQNSRHSLFLTLAVFPLLIQPAYSADTYWQFRKSTDRMSGEDKSYITTRSTNRVNGILGSKSVDLTVFCRGAIQVNSRGLGFKSDTTDCNEYLGCSDFQFVRTKVDEGDSRTYAFEVYDVSTIGFYYFGPKEMENKDLFIRQLQRGNQLLLEIGVVDFGEQIAEFSLDGFTAATNQCPKESSLSKILSVTDEELAEKYSRLLQLGNPKETESSHDKEPAPEVPDPPLSLSGDWYSSFPDYGRYGGRRVYRVDDQGARLTVQQLSEPIRVSSVFMEIDVLYQMERIEESQYSVSAAAVWNCHYPATFRYVKKSCPIELDMDITSVETGRISGKIFGPDFGQVANRNDRGTKGAYKKACNSCAETLPRRWKEFSWERKE